MNISSQSTPAMGSGACAARQDVGRNALRVSRPTRAVMYSAVAMKPMKADGRVLRIFFLEAGLLLLLVFSGMPSAHGEIDQEIGKPYFDRHSSAVGGVDSAALAPSGERLYTLKNGVLYQYGLTPLRRINSIDVDFDTHQTKDSPYRIFVTKNEKRLITYSKTGIRLLDMGTGKVIRAVSFESALGVLNDDQFLTLDNKNRAFVWNADELTERREVATGAGRWAGITNGYPGYKYDISNGSLTKADQYIVLYRPFEFYAGEVIVFDSKSYQQVWRIEHRDTTFSAISYDLETLYIPHAKRSIWHSGEYVDYLEEPGSLLTIDLLADKWRLTLDKELRRRSYYPLLRLYVALSEAVGFKQISPTHQYQIRGVYGGRITFHYPEKGLMRAKYFLQFEDGEAGLFSYKTNYFEVTEDARKHLLMKSGNGRIVPMNDATFKQYKRSDDHREW